MLLVWKLGFVTASAPADRAPETHVSSGYHQTGVQPASARARPAYAGAFSVAGAKA